MVTLLVLGITHLSVEGQTPDLSEFKDTMEARSKALLLDQEIEFERLSHLEEKLFQVRYYDQKFGMHVAYEPELHLLRAPLEYYYLKIGMAIGEECRFYRRAIAASEQNEYRLEFIYYMMQKREDICGGWMKDYDDWNYYIAIAANTEWANRYISSQELNDIGDRSSRHDHEELLSFNIICEWADSLNDENKDKAFSYLKKIYDGGPDDYGEQFFKLFHKLKPVETQQQLVSYWEEGWNKYDLYILRILSNPHTSPNEDAADILLQVRESDKNRYPKYLNNAIFYLDPEQGEQDFVVFLENEINGNRPLEDHYVDMSIIMSRFIRSASKDLFGLLLKYVESKRLGTFGDTYRREATTHLWGSFSDMCKNEIEKIRQARETESSQFYKMSLSGGFVK